MTNKITDNKMLKRLSEAMAVLGSRPTKSDFDGWRKKSDPTADDIAQRFGSWKKALAEAEAKPSARRWSDDDLLAILAEAIEAHDSRLTMPLFQEWASADHPNPFIYYERFGSWKKALKLVGGYAHGEVLKKERIVADLQRCADDIGDVSQATYNEWRDGKADVVGVDLSLIHISEPTRPY